jgi:hypothetical protein
LARNWENGRSKQRGIANLGRKGHFRAAKFLSRGALKKSEAVEVPWELVSHLQ